MQDINLNQTKLEVNGTYNKDGKITTEFEPTNNTDVINKAYLDRKLSKIESQISCI